MKQFSIVDSLIMGVTLGAQTLTAVSLLFPIAYFEPQLLEFMSTMKGNPASLQILSMWIVFLSVIGLVKATMVMGSETRRVLESWTRNWRENS